MASSDVWQTWWFWVVAVIVLLGIILLIVFHHRVSGPTYTLTYFQLLPAGTPTYPVGTGPVQTINPLG